MKSGNKIQYIIVGLLAVFAIVAAWIILFINDPVKATFSASSDDVILIDGEAPGYGETGSEDPGNGEISEVTATDTDEKKSLEERLQAVSGKYLKPDTGYIFVGDSRFVNMNDVCEISKRDNLFMVAKVGEGYSWFGDTALQQIKRIVSSGLFDKWKIIICLGINDLGNIEKYVNKYESLRDEYDITLVSVNPVNNYGNLSNGQIEKFNSVLTELSFPYIDTYHLLMSTGYATTDGLHYSGDTTRKIYNGILLGLDELTPGSLTEDSGGCLDDASLGKKKSIQSDILAQNKYVKKPPEPDTEIDEALMQELLQSLMENNGEIPEGQEGIEGSQDGNTDTGEPAQEEVQSDEQQSEENSGNSGSENGDGSENGSEGDNSGEGNSGEGDGGSNGDSQEESQPQPENKEPGE